MLNNKEKIMEIFTEQIIYEIRLPFLIIALVSLTIGLIGFLLASDTYSTTPATIAAWGIGIGITIFLLSYIFSENTIIFT